MHAEHINSPSGSSKPYQVLALRTRPQSFAALVGQEVVAQALTSMIASKKIPHAFLFTGTRGTGKTSSARILAKSLCCEHGPTADPCQTCVHCQQITACAHDDILEIDGASNTGVDSVRELRESARFYPNSARYKVFIIDEVHMLSTGAFNALLKTLEEPPPQVVFILATTELHKVPMTVRSRCMTLSFRKVAPEVIASHLANLLTHDGVGFEQDALALIAREAKGSLRDSLSLLEQVLALCGGTHINLESTKQALSILGQELAEQLLAAIAAKDASTALEILKTGDAASVDLSTLLDETASLVRNALTLSAIKDEETARRVTQLLPSEIDFLRRTTDGLTPAALSELFRSLMTGSREVGRSTAGLPWAQVTILDCVSRADWLSASQLHAMLCSGNRSTSSASTPGMRPQPPRAASLPSPKPPTGSGPLKSDSVLPPPPGAKAQPVGAPPDTMGPTRSDDPLNFEGFAHVIQHLRTKSPHLAAKLKSAIVDTFNTQLIQFSNEPSNKVYTTLNPTEAKTFKEALIDCGFGDAEIKGMDLPKDPRRAVAADTAAQQSSSSEKKNESDRTALVSPEPTPARTEKNRTSPRMEPGAHHANKAGGVSLADVERENKKNADLQRDQRIKSAPHLRKIVDVATRVEITSLEPESDGAALKES